MLDFERVIESKINHGMADTPGVTPVSDVSAERRNAEIRQRRKANGTDFPIALEMLRGCECRQRRRLHWMLGTGWAKEAWWLKKKQQPKPLTEKVA